MINNMPAENKVIPSNGKSELHGVTGLFDKKRQTHPTALLAQEQIIAAAGANAGTHSMRNCRSGVTVFLTCHGGIQNLLHSFLLVDCGGRGTGESAAAEAVAAAEI